MFSHNFIVNIVNFIALLFAYLYSDVYVCNKLHCDLLFSLSKKLHVDLQIYICLFK